MTIEGNFTRLFNSVAEYNETRNNDYYEPWVGYTIENSGVSFNKTDYEKLFETPITFNIISSGTIYWVTNKASYGTTIQYSTDNGETWKNITSNTGASAPSISVNAGDVVQFRGNNAKYGYDDYYYSSFSGSSAKFEIEGNIMSLIDSTGFATATTLASSHTFYYLFSYCTGLTYAENLILPAITLANSCYSYMFRDCTSLITAPSLPATALTNYCYQNMFNGCTSLTTAPELPATTLTQGCYNNMFNGCTALTTAPSLPATALTQSCYGGMFTSCTTLTTAPELPATTLADYCYQYMFRGCVGLTTAPELPATTLTRECYYHMFNGCTALTTAPSLPATALTQSCYSGMFYGCASLNYIKCLSTKNSAYDYTYNWVNGVASSGTFVKNPNMSSWTTGNNGIPTNWSVQDAS